MGMEYSKIVDYCFHELQIKSFGMATLGEAIDLRRISKGLRI